MSGLDPITISIFSLRTLIVVHRGVDRKNEAQSQIDSFHKALVRSLNLIEDTIFIKEHTGEYGEKWAYLQMEGHHTLEEMLDHCTFKYGDDPLYPEEKWDFMYSSYKIYVLPHPEEKPDTRQIDIKVTTGNRGNDNVATATLKKVPGNFLGEAYLGAFMINAPI